MVVTEWGLQPRGNTSMALSPGALPALGVCVCVCVGSFYYMILGSLFGFTGEKSAERLLFARTITHR